MVLLSIEQLDCGSLTGVNLDLSPGECVCLGGPSGSGKTRLLRALADLDPHSGPIRLNGRAEGDFPRSECRQHVAMLRAESAWWAPTVGEHMHELHAEELVRLGLPDEAPRWPRKPLAAGTQQTPASFAVS